MSRKKLAWAKKEVETFVCILAEEDVVYDVYVAAAAIDIRPTTKGTVGGGNATSELSWAIPPPPYRTEANRTVPHPAVETRHNKIKTQNKNPVDPKIIVMGVDMVIGNSIGNEQFKFIFPQTFV